MAYEDNEKFYAGSIKEYGVTAGGVHWNSKYSQYKRFETLSSFIKDEITSSSIVDVGCGFSEYYSYLKKNSLLPLKYIGIDCEEEMIEISQKRFNELTFIKRNVLEDTLVQADYYICSGALNILTRKEFFLFIKNCLIYCTKGFIFNFLKSDSYNYILKEEVLTFCKNLRLHIEIKENYLDNDFSIFLKK